MPLPPLPNVCKTAIVHQLHGQDVINTINWEFGGLPTVSGLSSLGEAVRDYWTSEVMPLLSFQCTLDRIEVRQLVPGAGLAVDVELDVPVAGSVTVDADNNQTAVSVKLKTALAGRSYNGRVFIGGVPNDIVQNGLLSDGYRTDVAAAVTSFLDLAGGESGAVPVVVSFFSLGAQRVTPVTTPILQAVSVTRYPAGQERRRPKAS